MSNDGNGEHPLRWLRRAVTVPYFWLLLFFLTPFLIILKISLAEPVVAQPPFTPLIAWGAEGFEGLRVTFSNYAFLFQDGYYGIIYLSSLKMAAIGTLLCLLLGYPMAYYIARQPPSRRHLLLLAVILPFRISFLLRVYAWIGLLNNRGIINEFLLWTGIIDAPLQMLYNDFAVYLGIVYSYLPFMILPLYAALERLDPRLMEAASDLYASGWATFRHVIWPLSLPGVVAGTLLTFIPATGDYINSRLLGNTQTVMIGQVIDSLFLRVLDYPQAAALSFILLLMIVTLVALYVRRAGTEELV